MELSNVKQQKISFPNECSIILRTGTFRTQIHYHEDAFELTWIKSGFGKRTVNNSKEAFNKDDLVLIGLRTPHVWQPSKNAESPESKVLHFNNLYWREILLVPEFKELRQLLDKIKSGLKILDGPLKDNVIEKMKFIESITQDNKERNNLSAFNGLLNILTMIVQSPESEYKYLNGGYTGLVNYSLEGKLKWGDVFKNIELFCCSKKREGQQYIMKKAGYTDQSRFSKDFQKITKITFNQYVYNIKEGKVKAFLQSTNEKIKDIYISCGVNPKSSYPFVQKFKTRNGCTPTEYRKKVRKENK